MGYIYEIVGIIISSAVVPVIVTLCWKNQNIVAAVASPILGTCLAIMSWLVCTKSLYKNLAISSTFMDYPMLTGNVVALLSLLIFVPVLSYVFKPQNFDWELLKNISRSDESHIIVEVITDNNVTDEESTISFVSCSNVSKAHNNEKNNIITVKSTVIHPCNTILSIIQDVSQEKLDE